MSWHDDRPVFSQLPQVGYQDNPTVDWLTFWVDQKLVDKANQLQSIYTKLDPATTDAAWLDYLGFLVGLSGNYWDVKWSSTVKRQMITNAHSLWSSRGTLKSIKKVLDIQGLTYSIWTNGSLRLPLTLPSTFGRDDLRVYIRMPLKYQRASLEFKEASRTLRNYAPAIVKSEVVFDLFYLGFSRISDPLFSS